MVRTVAMPPEAQLAPLLRAYDEAVAARRRHVLLGLVLAAVVAAAASVGAEVDPAAFRAGLGNATSYVDRLLTLDSGARVWTDPADWFWGLSRWSRLLGQTLLIAYVGTLTGAVAAFLACFLASRNLMRTAWVRFATRRLLEVCRTVPELVFTLVFIVAFGLGALSGVMAIAIHTAGALGKLFAEVVENIDPLPVEGVASTGASWAARIRFAVVPQVLSNFASYALLRLEINMRGAAVIGFVGAGGIGEELIVAIRQFHYADVSAILAMLMACVMAIDALSARLRHRLLALEGGR